MAGYDAQLRAEQEVVDTLYARLDALRAHTRSRLDGVRRAGPSGSPQNRSERDAFATLYENRLAQLEGVEERLVFGRLDLVDGELRYVGRIGLTDDDHDSLLTDWRAPAARAFYRATAAAPDGVLRRRHVVTTARTVTGVEDELLDIGAVRANAESSDSGRIVAEGLTGEGALLAALAAGRTGRMSDIVATIQAEQDVIIRDDLAGALVVQGGPGTGKTAVALHRAAYLLYAHRERLERSGVLMVGPSRAFLRYIDQVLPSLGETGVVSLTIAELIPGVKAAGVEDDTVAEIKGRAVMAKVVERAVAARHRVPDQATTVRIDGKTVRITPSDIAASITRAERMHRPHNEGRVTFVRDMLNKLATQYVRQLGFTVSPEDRADVVEELRSAREVRVALNLAWMPLTPQRLLADLWAKPYRLAQAAPMLTPAERDLLARPAGSPWTPADVPLLDEAAELLGEDDQAMQAQARADAAARSEQINYAREVLAISGNALVSAELLADRFESVGPSGTTADRAAADRTWAYGHIVVDEAQELSPMAWRALLRRVPTRSLTIVGDVAQTSAAAGTSNWAERLDPVLRGSWRQSDLTVSYRTPAVVAETAMAVARAAGLPVSDLVAARDINDSLVVVRVEPERLAAAVTAQVTTASALAGPDGSVAVIGEGLEALGLTSAGLGVQVLTPREAKGLEYDVTVLVEPAALRRPSDLYVAMTRSTRALHVVHAEALPAGWPRSSD